MRNVPTHVTAVLIAAMLALPAVASGDSIQLRSRATVSDAAVRLADVATLEGDLALALADTIVIRLDSTQSATTLTHDTLRTALAKAQVNWARISLKGFEKCEIVMTGDAPSPREAKAGAAIVAPASPISANPADEVSAEGRDTTRAKVIDWIRGHHGEAGNDIRIHFADRDAAVLAAPARQDTLIFSTPSSSKLGRVPVTIERLRNEKLIETQRISLEVTRRHLTLVAVRPISKGGTVSHEDVEVREVFVDCREDKLVTKVDDAIGLIAAVPIREGSLIRSDEAKPALMVRRNEQVRVQALAGGIVVTTQARALEDGGEGQMIQVRNERSRETFFVRVVGLRHVLIIVDGPASAPAPGNAAPEATPAATPASRNSAYSPEKQAKTTSP